jgi:hypothetical protein
MSDFQWCLFCERATKKRHPDQICDERCPTPSCEGSLGNLWDWDSFRIGGIDLPLEPIEGAKHPLSPEW